MSNFVAKSSSGDFERHIHPAGLFNAVVVDVIDIGIQETEWKGEKKSQLKVTVVWETTEQHPELEGPFRMYKTFTNSLHEKASLSKMLEDIRGKKFTKAERDEGFDMLKLLGVGCKLLIQHNESERTGDTYAKIGAFMPADKDNILKPSGDYEFKQKEGNNYLSAWAEVNGKKAEPPKQVPDEYQNMVAESDDSELPF